MVLDVPRAICVFSNKILRLRDSLKAASWECTVPLVKRPLRAAALIWQSPSSSPSRESFNRRWRLAPVQILRPLSPICTYVPSIHQSPASHQYPTTCARQVPEPIERQRVKATLEPSTIVCAGSCGAFQYHCSPTHINGATELQLQKISRFSPSEAPSSISVGGLLFPLFPDVEYLSVKQSLLDSPSEISTYDDIGWLRRRRFRRRRAEENDRGGRGLLSVLT